VLYKILLRLMAPKRQRVAIITNGNAFSNLAITCLLDATQEQIDYMVITTTGLRRSKGNRLTEAWGLARRWGWRYTTYKLATYIVPLLRQFLTGLPHFVSQTCQERDIPCLNMRSVNTPTARAVIAEFSPDLLISYSCPYKIYSKTLALPKIGCLNIHSSLLPKYAGVCTYIHVLADGVSKTGVTIHEMIEEFDAGRIVAQHEIPIEPGTSVCALFAKQCQAAGALLVDVVLDVLDNNEIRGEVQDVMQRSYCGEPESSDVSRLRIRGFQLARWRDFKALTPIRSHHT
jgi:folate-dependent phosphoribosylglycinamide formyltransferase PurN